MNSNSENTNSREYLTLDSIESLIYIVASNDGSESAMSENDADEYENEEGVFHGIFLTKK